MNNKKKKEQRKVEVDEKSPDFQKIFLGVRLENTLFPDNGMNYIAYTDGSCDNLNRFKVGGSGYVILKDGDIIKVKNKGFLHTTNNRMELLAIISVCNALPDGAFVDIFSDSQYSISFLVSSRGKKNRDLLDLYHKCASHLGGVRFHWVKGHDGDKYNEMADDLAFSAYREMCEEYNIPIGWRMKKTH